MLKTILTIGILISLFLFSGCSTDEKAAGGTTPATTGATPIPADPYVTYGSGFYGLEGTGDASFRWMSQEGLVKLKNQQKEMRLHIKGGVQMEQIPKSTLTITLNGQQLDQFPGAREIDKDYTVPVSKQGSGPTTDLSIKIDKVFIPKEVNPKTTDDRKLGFALNKLEWAPK